MTATTSQLATAALNPGRVDRITGSRVAAVLGDSDYDTPEQIMRAMVRQHHGAASEFTGNAATDWGHEHEADAIHAYEAWSGDLVHDRQGFYVHPEVPWLAVTLDGRAGDGIVEAKAPKWASYTNWRQRADYPHQMQLQMACAGVHTWADLVVWRPGGTVVSRLDYDPDWLPRHLPALAAFMDEYRRVCADPDLSAPHLLDLVDRRTDREWLDAEARWIDTRDDLAAAKAAHDDSKARLVELADGRKAVGPRVQVCPTRGRAGAIDWVGFVTAKGLDVAEAEAYRQEPSAPGYSVRLAGGGGE